MDFNLVHVIPSASLHGLYGYLEVIESIRWGLSELGHAVTVTQNEFVQGARNIIFGAQMLRAETVERFDANTIVYNLEQISKADVSKFVPSYPAASKRVRIWDYDPANIETWKRMHPAFEPALVPIGWAPTLRRIRKRSDEEIDILLYGSPELNRMRCVAELGNRGNRVAYVSGVYGALRDDLISRSKIVLNVNRYPRNRAFEIVRVSYLLGNGKAVVSDDYPEYATLDDEIRRAVAFSPLEQVVVTCEKLLADASERERLEAAGPAVMARRDIRDVLRTALTTLR